MDNINKRIGENGNEQSEVPDDNLKNLKIIVRKGEKRKMENTEYIMSSLEEYFEILDRENKRRSEMVAKSLIKYLQKSKDANKFEKIRQIAK